MTRRQRIAVWVGLAAASVLLVLAVALLVFTQSDWGRERVRVVVVDRLEEELDGEVEIGALEGNLLRRWRLIDVSITDPEDRPFVAADTIATGVSLRGLLRRRIVLRNTRMVNARVVLDHPPGERWNYARILPEPDPDPTRLGWGDWVRLERVTIINGRVTIRSEWRPDDELSPAERQRRIAEALDPEGRANIRRVPGGFQNVMDFRRIYAHLNAVDLADPERDRTVVDVRALRAIAQPYRPPVADVRGLEGRFYISQDSIWFPDVRARLPDSRLAGSGVYDLETADLILRLRGAPAAFADLRWLYPRLPEEGGGELELSMHRRQAATRIEVEEMDVRVRESELTGDLRFVVGDTVRILPTDVRFASFDSRLIERMIPRLDLPGQGTLDGRLALAGTPAAMEVDGDVVFHDVRSGRSHIVAEGGIGSNGQLRFSDLHLTMRPLRTDLLRDRIPRLPAGAAITGTAVLDGPMDGPLRVDADLALDDPATGRSRVLARGVLDPEPGAVHFSDFRLGLRPLRAELVRDELPQLPASATIAGDLRLDGSTAGLLSVNGDLSIQDPATGESRVGLAGGLALNGEVLFRDLDLRLYPLQADLIRDEVPHLPAGATLAGSVRLDGDPGGLLHVDGELTVRDPATGESVVGATGAVVLTDDFRVRDLDLRLAPLQLDLLRDEVPELPPGATAAGRIRLDGDPAGLLRMDGRLTIRDPATGESVVAANGAVDRSGELVFHSLDLDLQPLHLALVRRFEPELPLGGTLTGTATLNGRPGQRLAVRGDLVHLEAGERSHVAGRAEIVAGDWALVDVEVMPLSLVTLGRFVPEAGLYGAVSGSVRASGDMSELAISADLDVAGDGEIAVRGTLDLASASPGYDLETRMWDFDLAAVTARAPAVTSLTGTLDATGRGIDPASMRAELRADLFGSRVNGLAADEVRLRAGIMEGLARVDSSVVRLGSTLAWADGEFGLVAGRHGDLRYRVVVDSLHAVAPWVPAADTGVAQPRPPVRRAAIAEARAAAERAERRRLVETIATGRVPPAGEVQFDTLAIAGIPRDSLAGSLEAEGVISGNIETFDLTGRAEVDDLIFRGSRVGTGWAEYAWVQRGLSEPTIELDAAAQDLVIEGFAFDSAIAYLRHRGERQGTGRAVVAAWQDDATDYRVDAEFTLALDRSDLLLHDLELRFDTLTWRSTRPGRVSWDGDVIALETIELASDAGGLVYVDGAIPLEGAADLDLVLRDVELAHLGLLLQDDADLEGRVTLEAHVRGTTRNPVVEGVATLVDGARNGTPIPDVRAAFEYAGRELTLDADLFEDGHVFATVEGSLPIDLSLADRAGPLLRGGPLALDVRADSLPIDGISAMIGEVSNAEGVAAGALSVRGSWSAPVLEGYARVNRAAFTVDATGVRYRDATGAFRLDGATLYVDSLVARSGGPVRIAGTVDLSELTEPGFDLTVSARNAWAMRTDDVQLRLDADLEVAGPFHRVVITGEARTRQSVIYIPESRGKSVVDLHDPDILETLEGRLLAARDEVVEPPSPLLANLDVDVDLHIEPDTWIRSTDFNVEIYTPRAVGPLHVRLDQQAGRLTLDGTVNSDRGEYSFLGRRFRVTRGSATFTAGAELDPLLQVAAEHEATIPGREGITIRLVLGGTALEPTLTLESDARPPVSQTDLFTYIALGRSAGSLMQRQASSLGGAGGAGGDLAGNVAGLATQQMAAIAANTMLDEFESEMARELGLDVLHISPADLPSELFTGRFADLLRGTEIEMGRYIGPRWFASARARPTIETRPGATLEYSTTTGYRFTTSVDPRFLPPQPTLREIEPDRTSVFGAFVFREWRF